MTTFRQFLEFYEWPQIDFVLKNWEEPARRKGVKNWEEPARRKSVEHAIQEIISWMNNPPKGTYDKDGSPQPWFVEVIGGVEKIIAQVKDPFTDAIKQLKQQLQTTIALIGRGI